MSIISDFLNMLWGIVLAVISDVWSFVSTHWLVILAIIVICFAPYLATELTTWGAPSFMVTAMEGLSTLTPYVLSGLTYLATGVSWLATEYAGLGFWTQAALVLGAGLLLAPAETTQFINDLATGLTNLVGTVAGALGSAFLSSPLGIIAIGFGAWLLFGAGHNKDNQRVGGVA